MFIDVNEMKSKVQELCKIGEDDRLDAFGDMMQDEFNRLGNDYVTQFKVLSEHAEDANSILQYETVLELTEEIGLKEIDVNNILVEMKKKVFKNSWIVTSHVMHLIFGRHMHFKQISELLLPVLDTIKPVDDDTLLEDLNKVQVEFKEKRRVILLTEKDEEGMESVRKELQKYL